MVVSHCTCRQIMCTRHDQSVQVSTCDILQLCSLAVMHGKVQLLQGEHPIR